MSNFILAATSVPDLSLWDLIVKGGWLMIPLFALSVIAVYIIFERTAAIRKANVPTGPLIDNVIDQLQSGNKAAALQTCDAAATPVGQMLRKGILCDQLPTGELRLAMENTANKEIAKLEKGVPTLATIAGAAPMVGFLGTVIGMVQAFYDMSLAGNNINITLLSRGIYTAMITTVAGLIIGIVAYVAYNMLVSRIDRTAAAMENASSALIEHVSLNRK